MPPTERNGRVHTSTVTVAVFDQALKTDVSLYMKRATSDFKVEWFSGSGAGGQYRNKHQNSCRLLHLPTGLKQESQCRSRQNSYNEALAALTRKLDELAKAKAWKELSTQRKEQVGSGMRGDKVRTYREQDDVVIDHQSDRKVSLKRVQAGELQRLW